MRLLVISHMPHHMRDGVVVGWGPTARELDRLATRFERVRHIACLHPGPAPASSIPYAAKNIELVPVPPSGADGLLGKLDVLRTSPHYVRAILRELRDADMVHVRGPAHIALIAMLILSLRKTPAPRWFKYAGNWKPDGREAVSYHLQRWWLERGLQRGFVTVNGRWPHQPSWIRTFYNPSLDDHDIEVARRAAHHKQLTSPLQLLFVGRIETAKGAGRALDVVARLRARGKLCRLELIGDGDERARFELRAKELGIADTVTSAGWQPPTVVNEAYQRAHVLLLPTTASEGWPKVLSEGMAYGVVPIAGAISSIPQYVAEFGAGAAVSAHDIEAFAEAIARYIDDPACWVRESRRAVEATRWFSFSQYLSSVDELLRDLGLGRSPGRRDSSLPGT
jgi:glycosyltransferase involved in cell wall biosynthesis